MKDFKTFYSTGLTIASPNEFDIIVSRKDSDSKIYERFKETLLSITFSVKYDGLIERIEAFPYKHVLSPLKESAIHFLNYQLASLDEGRRFRICKQIIKDFQDEMKAGVPHSTKLLPKMTDGSDRLVAIRYFALERLLPILEKYKDKLIFPAQSPFIFNPGFKEELFEVLINLVSDNQNELVERFVANESLDNEIIDFSLERCDHKTVCLFFLCLRELKVLRIADASIHSAILKLLRFDKEQINGEYLAKLVKPSFMKPQLVKKVSDELFRINPALAESIVNLGLPKPTTKRKSRMAIT